MEFTADQVWGAAVAADRINGGYLKEERGHWADNGEYIVDNVPNKSLVKQWLREGNFSQVTEADIAAGREVRRHIVGYTLLAIAGKLNDFQTTALKIANMESFTGRDLYEFAVISCLPDVVRREQQRKDLKDMIYESEQLTVPEGESVVSDIEVVSCKWSVPYGKYIVQARMGQSYVSFWINKEVKGSVRIKAKVKEHRGDKTTKLNYVKIIG